MKQLLSKEDVAQAMGRIGSEEDAISRMKNLDASVHTRLAQRRARTGEDYSVLGKPFIPSASPAGP